MFANPGLLSTISGILAGFVITCLVLMLGNPPKDKSVDKIESSLFSLFVVFFSLILTSFLYAFVRLDVNSFPDACNANLSCKAGMINLGHLILTIASCVGALAVIQMYHGFSWLFHFYAIDKRFVSSVNLLYYLSAFIVLMNIVYLLHDLENRVIYGGENSYSLPDLWWILPIFFAPVFGFFIRFLNIRFINSKKIKFVIMFTMILTALFAFSGGFYSAIIFGFLDIDSPNISSVFSTGMKHVVAALIFVICLASTLTLPGSDT